MFSFLQVASSAVPLHAPLSLWWFGYDDTWFHLIIFVSEMLKGLYYIQPQLWKRKGLFCGPFSTLVVCSHCLFQIILNLLAHAPKMFFPDGVLQYSSASESRLGMASLCWHLGQNGLPAVFSSGFETPYSGGSGSGYPHIALYKSVRRMLFTPCQGPETIGHYQFAVIVELPGSLTYYPVFPVRFPRGSLLFDWAQVGWVRWSHASTGSDPVLFF